ncbi:MAG: hypothetical protein GY749_04175 [Desulfobacteraceae bacterium]|nr:hypothetical protein [Desulfobacteraceae bacterium]
MNQVVVVSILKKMGYSPDMAGNGKEALEVPKQKFFGIRRPAGFRNPAGLLPGYS